MLFIERMRQISSIARATAGRKNSGAAAWINTAGFATIVFNLFFINMVVAGLHSYAGV